MGEANRKDSGLHRRNRHCFRIGARERVHARSGKMSEFDSLAHVLLTTNPAENARKRVSAKLHGMPAVSSVAREIAQSYVMLATGYGLDADAFPNPDGGCAVAFYQTDERVEVSVSVDGAVT